MNYLHSNGDNVKAEPVSAFRRILPQILAGTAKNFLLCSIGAGVSYATIIIAALLNGDEDISMTDSQASWFGSVCFIGQPLGSLMSGVIMEPIGRKRAMMVVNLPHVAAWIMLWLGKDLTTLFIANAFLGLGTGLMEAPIIAYIGEICEPSVRGVMLSYSSVFSSAGMFGVYLLGTVLHWRTAAAVCLSIPIATVIAISMIPESPVWLLSKGRRDDAISALCWLRGWVEPSAVKEEFDNLERYNANNFRCRICESMIPPLVASECSHADKSRWERITSSLKDLTHRETLRPLILASLFFSFAVFATFNPIKPNMINIFKAFNMTLDANWATVGTGVISTLSAFVCMLLVSFTGKRPLVLTCMAGTALATLLLGVYAYFNIPHDLSTYAPIEVTGEASSIPLVLFIIMISANTLGVTPLTWVLASEIFPYKTRGNACGITAALCYIMNFVVTKTYINIEESLHLYGAFYLYAAITFVGLVYLYLALPETENRTHAEIEADFACKNNKIYANDFIAKKIKSVLENKKYKPTVDLEKDRKVEGINNMNYKHISNESAYFNKGYLENGGDILGKDNISEMDILDKR